MKIIKQSGQVVDFNIQKLKHSLLKSGASIETVEKVLAQIESQLYEGISTRKIYKLAFSLLKKSAKSHAARYNLRTAIQQLGPAGFYFEKFIAELFSSEGYSSKTNLFLNGKCISHEIDVVIKKDDLISIIECKFHSTNDKVTDVKVPMYILSRFNDLKSQKHSIFSNNDEVSKCIIVTNNRFTSDAIAFGTCSGLQLLSWDYPAENCLRKKVDRDGLYPITCLTTISSAEKSKLLELGLILVSHLIKTPDLLSKIGISQKRSVNILREATELCNYI
ncbi:restriction endonuclease [Flavobacterium capsici]|uniref:Restriction endonuclease n=1 Tax=Flavobacterium capsici TaxID=3075618 RepID=A0AA96EXS1_9FLAO|nr:MULTISPECIES: ATP cone domain-containing protein [unclassified Flavobacterium]WNM19164.1 restriction endonuclease [Flavobacterium sp. PMR2A8]WNM20553.1 restriction endonuclease [Flavobacterium sp. PMTSA4]